MICMIVDGNFTLQVDLSAMLVRGYRYDNISLKICTSGTIPLCSYSNVIPQYTWELSGELKKSSMCSKIFGNGKRVTDEDA